MNTCSGVPTTTAQRRERSGIALENLGTLEKNPDPYRLASQVPELQVRANPVQGQLILGAQRGNRD